MSEKKYMNTKEIIFAIISSAIIFSMAVCSMIFVTNLSRSVSNIYYGLVILILGIGCVAMMVALVTRSFIKFDEQYLK